MRRHFLLLQGFIILSLGLISCSPDPQSEVSEPESNLSVEIRNSDETIQKIQKTKSLRVSSHIALNENDSPQTYSTVTTLATCRTNHVQGVVEKVSEHKNIKEVPVKDVLPSLIFTPSETPGQASCTLDIHMQDEKHPDVRIRIVDVQILDVETFQNYEIDFLRSESQQPLFFHHSDLTQRNFKWPKTEGTVETLCSDSRSQTLLFGEPKPTVDFFPDSLFLNHNLEKCRLVFQSEQTTWVTQTFYVQRHPSNLKIEFNEFIQSGDRIEYRNEPIMKFTIVNQGEGEAFIKINTPKTKIRFTPLFTFFPSSLFNTEVLSLSGEWRTFGTLEKEHPNSQTQSVYRVVSGGHVEVVLMASGAFDCPAGNLPVRIDPHASHPHCNDYFYPVKMGSRFSFEGFPSFNESVFESVESDQWKQPVSLKPNSEYNSRGVHQFWMPSSEFRNRCPYYRGTGHDFSKKYETRKYPLRSRFHCNPF